MDFPDKLTDEEMRIRFKECKIGGVFSVYEESEGALFVDKTLPDSEVIIAGYAWLDGAWRRMPMSFLAAAFNQVLQQYVGDNMRSIMQEFNKHTHAPPPGVQYPGGPPTLIPASGALPSKAAKKR